MKCSVCSRCLTSAYEISPDTRVLMKKSAERSGTTPGKPPGRLKAPNRRKQAEASSTKSRKCLQHYSCNEATELLQSFDALLIQNINETRLSQVTQSLVTEQTRCWLGGVSKHINRFTRITIMLSALKTFRDGHHLISICINSYSFVSINVHLCP